MSLSPKKDTFVMLWIYGYSKKPKSRFKLNLLGLWEDKGSFRLMSKGIISWIKCALCLASLNDYQPSWTNNSAMIAQVMSHGVLEGENQGQKWKVMGETAILDPHNLMGHWLLNVRWGPLIIHLWLAHLKSILRSQRWQGENVCAYVLWTLKSRFIENFKNFFVVI